MRDVPGSLPMLLLLLMGCRTAATPATTPLELQQGIVLVERGELEGGISALRTALAAASGNVGSRIEAHRWIGHALAQLGDPEGALEEYRSALELAPEDPWLYYASGVAWYRMGELERALESFTYGVEFDPRHIKSLQWRARVLLDLGDDRAAVEDLTLALELIESADDSMLAGWGADRRTLLMRTLDLRLQAFDALGMHEAAGRERARLATLVEQP